jgi:hypothetical protein
MLWFPLQSLAMTVTTLLCDHETGATHQAAGASHASHCEDGQEAAKTPKNVVHVCDRCAVCVLSLSAAIPIHFDSLPIRYAADTSVFVPSVFVSFIPDQFLRPPLSLG